MKRYLAATAVAFVTAAALTSPAHAIRGWAQPNGVDFNGGDFNGAGWNGVDFNGKVINGRNAQGPASSARIEVLVQ